MVTTYQRRSTTVQKKSAPLDYTTRTQRKLATTRGLPQRQRLAPATENATTEATPRKNPQHIYTNALLLHVLVHGLHGLDGPALLSLLT